MNNLYLNYSDIVLLPDFSDCASRSSLSSKVNFLGREFNSPVMPANMKTTIDFFLATELSEAGYFYVLHRFYDYENILSWIDHSQDLKTISISIGVKEADKELIRRISEKNLRVDFITIDVAHGYHTLVSSMIMFVKDILPNVKIIAGNIGTYQGVQYLQAAGADAIKVGLAYGAACFLYDTLVSTESGHKPIGEITVKDKVLSKDGIFHQVINTFKNETIELMNVNGVVCTPDHKFLVIDLKDSDKDVSEVSYYLEAGLIDINKHLLVTCDTTS